MNCLLYSILDYNVTKCFYNKLELHKSLFTDFLFTWVMVSHDFLSMALISTPGLYAGRLKCYVLNLGSRRINQAWAVSVHTVKSLPVTNTIYLSYTTALPSVKDRNRGKLIISN